MAKKISLVTTIAAATTSIAAALDKVVLLILHISQLVR